MRKILFLALCFLFVIIAGCKNSIVTECSTTKEQKTSAESINNTIDIQTSENKEITFIQTETHSEMSYATTSTKVSECYDDSPAADILQFDIETLKALKKVAETMSDAEFESYLEESRLELAWFEMVNTIEKFNSLLDDIENIYVAVLDENLDDVFLTYYVNEKRVFQSVTFSETRRFGFDFYISGEPLYYYANINGTEYVKTVEINSVKADVYRSDRRNGFCADAVLGEQEFDIRVNEAQTIEEFEEDFSRLSFVKIGDLLNE